MILLKKNSIFGVSALILSVLHSSTGSTKGGRSTPEELYNPEDITSPPLEIRQIVFNEGKEPRATLEFFTLRAFSLWTIARLLHPKRMSGSSLRPISPRKVQADLKLLCRSARSGAVLAFAARSPRRCGIAARVLFRWNRDLTQRRLLLCGIGHMWHVSKGAGNSATAAAE